MKTFKTIINSGVYSIWNTGNPDQVQWNADQSTLDLLDLMIPTGPTMGTAFLHSYTK